MFPRPWNQVPFKKKCVSRGARTGDRTDDALGPPASRRPVPSCGKIVRRWLSRATSGGPQVAPSPLRPSVPLRSPFCAWGEKCVSRGARAGDRTDDALGPPASRRPLHSVWRCVGQDASVGGKINNAPRAPGAAGTPSIRAATAILRSAHWPQAPGPHPMRAICPFNE